ncbi:MAG: hypothetical protein RJA25_228 [Bacteroidota bacterium]|jgi:hypothetical protein
MDIFSFLGNFQLRKIDSLNHKKRSHTREKRD